MGGADKDRPCGSAKLIKITDNEAQRLFPRTKFADENTVEQQIAKIRSEVEEAFKEKDDSAFLTEVGDVVQAFITLCDIEPLLGGLIIKGVIDKNDARGYYDK